jgi:hypothetical protein
MKKPVCRPVSLISARSGRRVRVSHFLPGAALVPVCAPMPILGYWFRQVGGLSQLTVYVAGTMPLALRTAAEQHCTAQETWLAPVPGGVREIDLTDCRQDFHLVEPSAKVLTMYPTAGESSDALAA